MQEQLTLYLTEFHLSRFFPAQLVFDYRNCSCYIWTSWAVDRYIGVLIHSLCFRHARLLLYQRGVIVCSFTIGYVHLTAYTEGALNPQKPQRTTIVRVETIYLGQWCVDKMRNLLFSSIQHKAPTQKGKRGITHAKYKKISRGQISAG